MKSSFLFNCICSPQHERTTSSTSLSPVSPSPANGHHHGHPSSHHGQPRYPPYSFNTTSTPVLSSNLIKTGSSGSLLSTNTIPRGTGNSAMKIYSSASGNHLSSKPTSPSTTQAPKNTDATDAKMLLNDSGDAINNNVSGVTSSSSSISPVTIPHSLSMFMTSHQQSNQSNHEEDSDAASYDSVTRSQSHSALNRGQLIRSPEYDHNSVESLQSSRSSYGMAGKKSKKMKFLPNFLTKKGKQKTT